MHILSTSGGISMARARWCRVAFTCCRQPGDNWKKRYQNQSINQSSETCTNQPTNQSINQWRTNQSINRAKYELIKAINQSINRTKMHGSINQSIDEKQTNQPINIYFVPRRTQTLLMLFLLRFCQPVQGKRVDRDSPWSKDPFPAVGLSSPVSSRPLNGKDPPPPFCMLSERKQWTTVNFHS